jgi:hypothetical protein
LNERAALLADHIAEESLSTTPKFSALDTTALRRNGRSGELAARRVHVGARAVDDAVRAAVQF